MFFLNFCLFVSVVIIFSFLCSYFFIIVFISMFFVSISFDSMFSSLNFDSISVSGNLLLWYGFFVLN